ncbi:unnamed protein product, partial [Rotaria magnacalcarata]
MNGKHDDFALNSALPKPPSGLG